MRKMRGSVMALSLWVLFFIALLIWILGLALSWGGWIWIFFVLGLAAVVINVLALTGRGRKR